MPDTIDLRGTQGAVVLPGGTVTQHYPDHNMTQPQSPGDHTQQEHTIDIALLKNEIVTHRGEIRDLWTAIGHIRDALRPKTIDLTTLIMVVVVIVSATIAIIYAGGNWGQ